jgi:hypothetical protein
MNKPIINRGFSVCRACDSRDLVEVLDLGSQPLPSEYGYVPNTNHETFPLKLQICRICGLGQIAEFVSRERIFHKKYPYISSASSTWVEHTSKFAKEIIEELGLKAGSLVIEIASNDGSLLSEFKKLGMKVLGIEPAENVGIMSKSLGIPTVIDFFGESLANDILRDYGRPKLIVANNVFAHVPDMQDFTKGLAILSGKETIITIENPSFLNLLKNSLFDTIYHEHYSYLSANSVSEIAKKFNLNLIKVDRLLTHGGSNRYWLSKSELIHNSVAEVIREEKEFGLFDPRLWNEFRNSVNALIGGLQNWLTERITKNDVVIGYGAAHKGNTFLNSVGEKSKCLKYVVDASIEKHGKYLPGSNILVVPPTSLNSQNPTDILILPWNLEKEISAEIRKFNQSARIWVAHPNIHRV